MPIEYILLGGGIVLLGIEAVVPGFGFFGVTGLISQAHIICWAAALRPRIFCLVLYWHWAQ